MGSLKNNFWEAKASKEYGRMRNAITIISLPFALIIFVVKVFIVIGIFSFFKIKFHIENIQKIFKRKEIKR